MVCEVRAKVDFFFVELLTSTLLPVTHEEGFGFFEAYSLPEW